MGMTIEQIVGNQMLNKMLDLKPGNIIKVQLRYELYKGTKSQNPNPDDILRYRLEFFLKLKGSDTQLPISSLHHLIEQIILKKYICPVQIDRISWKFLILTHVDSKRILLRLPLFNCSGTIKLPLSKVPLDSSYIYHLYHNAQVPARFTIKGIPNIYATIEEFNKKLFYISSLFTQNLPLVHLDNKNSSYFKFVKEIKSMELSERHFVELDSAYPWGFITQSKKNRVNKPKRKKKGA